MVYKSIDTILEKISLMKYLDIEDFEKIAQDILEYFQTTKIYSKLSRTERFEFRKFHDLTVKMLVLNPEITIDRIFTYNKLITNFGELLLADSCLNQWFEIYSKHKFTDFLNKISLTYITKANNEELLNIIKIISNFVKDHIIFDDKFRHIFKLKLDLIFRRISDNDICNSVVDAYKNLNHTLIKKNLDFDFYVNEQQITVEINPLSEDLSIKPLKFENFQQVGDDLKGAIFNNQNIKNLNIDVHPYGFDGKLKLDLIIDSENLHSDYLFLYHGMPMSIMVTIKQIYKFKTLEDKEESFVETLAYHGLSLKQNHSAIFSKRKERNNSIELNIDFCDPLKALLSESHPMRIAKNVSYSDLIKKIFTPYKELIEIDNQVEDILKQKLPQIFIFCDAKNNRSLYDFLIETLAYHKINLQCLYTKKLELSKDKTKINKKTNYTLYSIEKPLKDYKRDYKLPEIANEFNLWNIDKITINRNQNIIATENKFNLDAKTSQAITVEEKKQENKKEDQKITLPKAIKLADKILYDEEIFIEQDKDRYKKYNEIQQKNWTEKHNYQTNISISWEQLPFTEILYPSLQVLAIDKNLESSVGQYSKQINLTSYNLDIKQNTYTQKWIQNALNKIGDNPKASDEKAQAYLQKLAYLRNFPNVSHIINLTQKYQNNLSQKLILPKYQSFVSHSFYTSVFSRKEVDPKKQNEYKLVKSKDNSETAYNTKDAKPKESDALLMCSYADDQPHIKLRVPKSILFEESQDEVSFIYLPADQGHPFANQYFPYTQGDILEVKAINQETLILEKLISNRFLVDKKASEEFIQQTYYGLNDETSFSYHDDNKDSQLIIKQKHPEEKGFKQILFSQKQGISVKFTTKQN